MAASKNSLAGPECRAAALHTPQPDFPIATLE
jgi:hypothetical protein